MTTKELAFAASTIWVVIAAILVLFMQAGFAFLEAGLTRMKNVGHIAAKNVLILAIVVDRLLPRRVRASRSATAATASSAAPGSCRRSTSCSRSARRRSRGSARSPAAAGYLFEVVVRGRLARDRLGRDGRADAALGVLRVRRRLHADLLGRLALGLEPRRLAVLEGHAGLRRLDGRPLPGRARGPRRRAAARRRGSASSSTASRSAIPGHNMAFTTLGVDHPLVRLVRVQPRLDALASTSAASASSPTSR